METRLCAAMSAYYKLVFPFCLYKCWELVGICACSVASSLSDFLWNVSKVISWRHAETLTVIYFILIESLSVSHQFLSLCLFLVRQHCLRVVRTRSSCVCSNKSQEILHQNPVFVPKSTQILNTGSTCSECKQWLWRLGCKPHPTPYWLKRNTNWVSELVNVLVSVLESVCPQTSGRAEEVCVVFCPSLCVCGTCRMCPCAVWGPHCGFLFLPTNLSLSSLPLSLSLFAVSPSLARPLPPLHLLFPNCLTLPSLSLSLSLSLSACQEEVNNMTFSRSDNILPREFPAAPAFLSHSHRFVFAPGASVFLRNDHLGTRWLTSSTGGGREEVGPPRGQTQTDTPTKSLISVRQCGQWRAARSCFNSLQGGKWDGEAERARVRIKSWLLLNSWFH